MALYMIGFISYGATLVFYAAAFPRLARNTAHSRDLKRKYEAGEIAREEYEVEEVVDSKEHRGKIQFLVKWKGYDEKTWEPRDNLVPGALGAIKAFYKKHPGAPRAFVARLHLSSFKPIFQFTKPDRTNGWSGRPTLTEG